MNSTVKPATTAAENRILQSHAVINEILTVTNSNKTQHRRIEI